MAKLETKSSQIWEAFGLEKDVIHQLEFKFECSASDIINAAMWVASKVTCTETCISHIGMREMQVSSRALNIEKKVRVTLIGLASFWY
jgi:hypothetical protein